MDNGSEELAMCWHAVATGAEVTTSPIRVVLLGVPWVLVRLHGDAVAFLDRCPHRGTPLSTGSSDGSTLECSYHGWSFGASGTCVAIPKFPADAALPSGVRAVTPYGVEERYGLVWLAPVEPVCDIVSFPEW